MPGASLRPLAWPSSSQRTFSTTSVSQNWLRPNRPEKSKSRVGRPRIQTGGSMRGTTVCWGDYGLRMKDHDRRISSKQLQLGYDTIMRKLRGSGHFKLYTRVSANIGVYTKGNEQRMGKGKGKFDYWAARVPVSRIIFELSGNVHEKVVREAFRLAGDKLPGQWETVKKGDPPVVGVTKLNAEKGITFESLKRARKDVEPMSKDASDDAMVISTIEGPPKTVSTDTETV
ncbi:39S ribosomal protein L16, mitochondrial [Lithohypha guttulata]|uniref:39S ribosomal protein L16, mitochondrial n=1 Tax=Lithohypha guttulata TaxID=1690604 RepID=A0AAN7T189_9EURO|nr:39S ribosomal protein L16, mitochondrial [Lithohypha guttulata]KAK5099975.1 39S ribosomal protein L16, mitochondrial [Lithohypha guttulata]